MTENSRWDLAEDDVGRYLARSYDFIIDLLMRMDRAEPYPARPVGRRRRCAWRSAFGGTCSAREATSALHEEAERQFGMPATALAFSARLRAPLYAPGARRQQLIHALGVGAALRLLHHVADQHALQPPLAAKEALRFGRVLGEHLVDPARERRVVGDLEQSLALGDLRAVDRRSRPSRRTPASPRCG